MDVKLGSNLVPFAKLRDRFVPDGYTDGCDVREGLERLAAIDGVAGVGFGWPGAFQTPAELRTAADNVGLDLTTLEPDVYTERRFARGSLTHPAPAIRAPIAV